MKTAIGLVGVFCLAQEACALSPGEHYQVHFSPNVTNTVHTAVEEAAAQWSEAVGVQFDVYQGGNCEMQTYCIYVSMSTAEIGNYSVPRGQQEGETDVNTANQSSNLHIMTYTPAYALQHIAVHELGHALGLMHSDDKKYDLTDTERKGAQMFPYYTGTHPSATLTDADLKMYFQERGLKTDGIK